VEGVAGEETWDAGDGVENRICSIKKPLSGSEYVMTYFVLHFIPGGRQIISQLVCNESAQIWVFVVFCGGGCCC
jgi:hypothetical protein